jgi:predicted ATPase
MLIQRLRVTNFRSFRELDLELSPFSVVVGANASGKTNFVQLFRFLRDVAIVGFDVAIARQGGVEQIRGSHVGKSEPLTIELEGAFAERTLLTYANIKPRRYHYSFTIQFTRGRAGYRVAEERFRVWLEGAEAKQHAATLMRHGNHFEMVLPSALFKKVSPKPAELAVNKLAPSDSILQMFWIIPIPRPKPVFAALGELGACVSAIVAYDFDVDAMKRPTRIESRPQLQENGANLASTLRELFRSREQRRTFHRILQQFLPEVQGVSVQVEAETSVSYSLREQHLGQRRLPSDSLSDGTVMLIGLIVALYFTQTSLLIIEEPDRHLHPALIGRLMHHLKETAWRQQILVTTHNPEVVRHTPLESLLLVQRDREGFSQITRPSENEYVKHFLQHELGLHELFVDNLLGVRNDSLPTG